MPVDQTPAISDEERKQKLQTDFEAIFNQYDIGKIEMLINSSIFSSSWTIE